MKEIKFRNLYPTEIQVRPTDTKFKGSCTLLLYKDARSDMDILDESLGCENWQKEYYEVNGNVYCRIGILTENGWVWKSDCGIESNVDAAKGEASDAAKRAAVCWGIGRELYTTPRVRIKCPDSYYKDDRLTMSFYVQAIEYEGKRVTKLVIADRFGKVVYDWDAKTGVKAQNEPVQAPQAQGSIEDSLTRLRAFCVEKMREEPEWSEDVKKFGTTYADKLKKGWTGPFLIDTLYSRWISTRKV